MSDSSVLRERVIHWEDPIESAKSLRAVSGIDAIRGIMSGEIPAPPVARLIGCEITLVESGKVHLTLVPNESHYNTLGVVHGGVIATMLDTAVGCAVQTMLRLGKAYTTLNISVSYIRAVTVGTGAVTAEGVVVHTGRSTAIAHGRLVDSSGKLLATAESTCLIFDTPGNIKETR